MHSLSCWLAIASNAWCVCFIRSTDCTSLLYSIFQDKIGRCIMTLTRAILEGEFTESFPLDGTESGRLNVRVKWAPQTIIRD